MTRRADLALRVGPPPAPVADVSFLANKQRFIGRHSNIEKAQRVPVASVHLQQAVGHVQSNVKTAAVPRQGQPGGHFALLLGYSRSRQFERLHRHYLMIGFNFEHFYAAGDARQKYPLSIWRKNQPVVAGLATLVRLKNVFRNSPGSFGSRAGR